MLGELGVLSPSTLARARDKVRAASSSDLTKNWRKKRLCWSQKVFLLIIIRLGQAQLLCTISCIWSLGYFVLISVRPKSYCVKFTYPNITILYLLPRQKDYLLISYIRFRDLWSPLKSILLNGAFSHKNYHCLVSYFTLIRWIWFSVKYQIKTKTWNSHYERAVQYLPISSPRSHRKYKDKYCDLFRGNYGLISLHLAYQQILWQISTSIVANVTTIVGFRGNHGLLGLQSGEDPACGSVPHAGRCSELKTWTYLGQCMILIFLGKKDAQQVKRADGALGKALALQAAGIQVFIPFWCLNSLLTHVLFMNS